MQGYKLILLKDYINEMREDDAKSLFSLFSCPINHDVEKFLRISAIEFEKQSISTTYLLFASHGADTPLIAYFTLAVKVLTLSPKIANQKTHSGKRTSLSKNLLKRIAKFGMHDRYSGIYTIPAPLIGQIGKNFTNGYNKLISGDELLKIACDRVWYIQRLTSGKLVYLECEDTPKLTDFYFENGFVEFGKRMLDNDEKDSLSSSYYVQMLKYIAG